MSDNTPDSIPTPNEKLQGRIDAFNANHKRHRNASFTHFMCPILFVDEHVALCMGHVVPKSVGGTKCVPQREDVDELFGRAFEPRFEIVVRDREKDLVELLLNNTNNRHTLRVEIDGKPIDHYFTKRPSNVPDTHTLGEVKSGDETLGMMAFKITPDEAKALDGTKLEIVIERDFVPSVIASVIKASHLTMFSMLGYEYAYSHMGRFVANILSTFYMKHKGKKLSTEEWEQETAAHFTPYRNMVLRLLSSSTLEGTIDDNKMMCLFTARRCPRHS